MPRGDERPTDVLEREREVAAVDALLDDVAAGRGRGLLIEAPAGLGKTTLIEYAVQRAGDQDVLVLQAAGRELERTIGFGIARSLFESWLLRRRDEADWLDGPAAGARPLFGAGPPSAPALREAAFEIQHGVFWIAASIAARAPLLLVVDDAHWADEPSLALLLYVLGRIGDRSLGVLVSARPGEAPAGGALESMATDPHVTVVEPAPLGPDAVAQLVRSRRPDAGDDFCARCHQLTAGNPLWLHVLLKSLADGLAAPEALERGAAQTADSLRRLIQRRLLARSAAARQLARAVAVWDTGVPLHRAAVLADLDPVDALAAAAELADADLFRRDAPDDVLDFAHPLLRATAYRAMSAPERTAAHRRAAAQLIAEHADEEQIAAHLLHVAPAAEPLVVTMLQQAAAAATTRGVPASAVAYLERALREPPATGDQARVLAELGRAEWIAGRRAAVAHLEEAIRRTVDPDAADRLLLDLARALHDFNQPDRACDVLADALPESAAADGASELARELEAAYLTSAVAVPDRVDDAHRRTERIFAAGHALLRTPGGRTLASKALIMRTYDGGSRDRLVPLARALLAGGDLIADGGIGSQAIAHVINALSFCDEYDAAESAIALADAEVERAGWVTWRAALATLAARQRLATGPVQDAVDRARSAVAVFTAGGQLYLPSAGCVLVRGLLAQDDLDAAAAVGDLVAHAQVPRGMFAAWQDEARGHVAARRGDHAAAVEAFLACGRVATQSRVTNPALIAWRSDAALAARRLGETALAERLVREELDLAERLGAPRAIAVARRTGAVLRRGPESVDALADAVRLLAGCGARVEQARTLYDLGAALRRTGRRTDARHHLRAAITLAGEVGARYVERLAREELAIAGGRPPVTREAAPALTPSERRIAELAASGLTNREIAAQLYVSVKNVEWHLANAYRRLGISRRRELPAALARLDATGVGTGVGP